MDPLRALVMNAGPCPGSCWYQWMKSLICMLGCEQVMLMLVPSVASADGSCCTWALPAATAEKEDKHAENHWMPLICRLRQPVPQENPRERVRQRESGSETEAVGTDVDVRPVAGVENDLCIGVWRDWRRLRGLARMYEGMG